MAGETPSGSGRGQPPGELEGGRLQAPPWGGRAPVVIVPLDGSPGAKAALPVARIVARLTGASLHAVLVTRQPPSAADLPKRMGLRREETHGLVLDVALGVKPDAVVQTVEEKQAMLVVLAIRGRARGPGEALWPDEEAIVELASCPIVLVRPEVGRGLEGVTSFRRLLLPLDGAPSSAAVIGPALDLARRAGAEVDILYVASPGRPPREAGSFTVPLYLDQPQHEWPEWALEFTSRFGTALGQYPMVTATRLFLRRGDPTGEIVRFAREKASDLIVLEWRGGLDPVHSRVARGVLAEAPCPTMLLRSSAGQLQPWPADRDSDATQTRL